jgi:hypothetical protein
MAYSNYSIPKLKQQFQLEQNNVVLFDKKKVKGIKPSRRLMLELGEGQTMPLLSEKAKSELLISPILREIHRKNPSLSIFSGYTFNIEGNDELSGAPDFLISNRPNKVEIEAPVFCLVESKNKTPDEGYAQCAAEMYAARLFNQQMGEPYENIYGAVTNAFEWVFMKLDGNNILIDQERYFIIEIPKLLGAFQIIIDQYK